jgi:hypothetical protein
MTSSRLARAALAVVGALFAIAVLGSFLPGGGASGGRSPSSSYSTKADGLAAYTALLARFGHPVERLRGDLLPGALDPAATVVVLDAPGLSPAEAKNLGRFVRGGGRLIAGGLGADEWLSLVLDDHVAASEHGVRSAEPLDPAAPEVDGVRTVRTDGAASWGDAGRMVPVLGGQGRAVAATASPGQGRVIALADPSALQNHLLGEADNAAFGLALAGASRSVRFDEGPHGYGQGEGLAALPRRWRLAMAGLGLAAAVWLLARSRRLGPPEDEARTLPPPRRAYVDALAGTLARTGRAGEAAEPVRARVRALVAQRSGLPAGASGEELRRAAERLGLPPDEVAMVAGDAGSSGADEPAILAAGRALARLNSGPNA